MNRPARAWWDGWFLPTFVIAMIVALIRTVPRAQPAYAHSARGTGGPPAPAAAEQARSRRYLLPLPTFGALLVFALAFWVNALLHQYRFNVALAVLATIPVAVLTMRVAVLARPARRDVGAAI